MKKTPGKFLKVLFSVFAAIYPVLIFTFLVILKLDIKFVSLFIILMAAAYFISAGTNEKGQRTFSWKPVITSFLLLAVGILCIVTNKDIFLKLYPVAISVLFLFIFGSSLFSPPTIIFRFALLSDKKIEGSAYEDKIRSYCKKVTIIWCCFFILNGSISAFLSFLHHFLPSISQEKSTIICYTYTGGISYILMGLLFAIEFIVRKVVNKKMIKPYPISKFKANSRNDKDIICYEDTWNSGKYKTWKDFLTETAIMRKYISSKDADQWILHCEDYWMFLVTFIALLQCNKEVALTQNIAPSFMNEVRNDKNEFLTDQNADENSRPSLIHEILKNAQTPSEDEIRTTPEINSEETRILLFTSGSTGKPKAVQQRMKEFEEDNAFIISKWGKEFTSRNLVTTVSQHHIYGFLFGICLPFTLGVPFRRKRIEFPEEFEKLTDSKYIIIATPAFLKRTVEVEESLNMNDTWIFTSGGAVSPELAVSTEKLFGFCPLEVYGSTETSGIAYRQQNKDKNIWTPFDNAKVWKGEDGCLRIISPYIKNPEGFATADLVEFTGEDQKFILKGRSDSIVKIEEKRISVTEVENRILETGLVNDVKVIALSNDVRQYLAAVIVLNEKGRAQFKTSEKFDINKYFHDFLLNYFENVVLPKKWRYVEKIPVDVQGKKHINEIKAMFEVN